jgi:hypothetical protein
VAGAAGEGAGGAAAVVVAGVFGHPTRKSINPSTGMIE